MMVIDKNLTVDTLGIRNYVELITKNTAKCEVIYDDTWNEKKIMQIKKRVTKVGMILKSRRFL